jgi:hypothetical protein
MEDLEKKRKTYFITLIGVLLFIYSNTVFSQSNPSGIEDTEIKKNTNLEEPNINSEKGSSQKEIVDTKTESRGKTQSNISDKKIIYPTKEDSNLEPLQKKDNTSEEINPVEKVQNRGSSQKKVANVAQSVVTNFIFSTLWKFEIENEELDIINLVDILTITIAVLILFILIFYFYFRQKIKKLAQTRKGVEVIAFTLKSQEERINALEQMIGG